MIDIIRLNNSIQKKASIAWSFFIDLLYPIECLDCGREGEWLCADCLLKIKIEDSQICHGCGGSSLVGAICGDCKPSWSLDGVLAAMNYDLAVTNKLVRSLKYGFVKDLGAISAQIFLKFLKTLKVQNLLPYFLNKKIIFIPVPLHSRRLSWRGFNQSELIAHPIASALGGEFLSDVLIRNKNSPPQTNFTGSERQANIEDCFSYTGGKEQLTGKYVIIIDDVITTGATMNECAKVLKKAGAKNVWAFALARG